MTAGEGSGESGETLCLGLGGTNERTSSKAELGECSGQDASVVCGDLRVGAGAGASCSVCGGCDDG